MANSKLEPAIRVDGARRVNLADQRARREAAERSAKPVEDDRVSQAWARSDAKRASAAASQAERRAVSAMTPKVLVENVLVPNPEFSRDHVADKLGNYKKITAAQNIRESAIVTLFARGLINDAQEKAAERFRGLWEAMGGSGVGALDYTREPVDGSGAREPISERQANAGRELARCRDLLGMRGYALVSRVCGEGQSLFEIGSKRRDRDTAADNLRGYLDDLCGLWKLGPKKSHGPETN